MLPMSRYGNMSLIAVAGLCCAVVGCSSGSSTIPNPFAQADRVPSPPTRVPAPGQAIPNYGGWPAGTPAAPVSYPGVAPVAPTNGFGVAPAARPGQIAGGGGSVGIPTDNQSLRFESPPPSLEQPIVEIAARNLPPGTNLGGPATFVPPTTAQPATGPRVRMPQGNSFVSEPITPSTYQVAGQIRQRPAIRELPPQQQQFSPAVVDQTADGFRARGAARDMMGATEPTMPQGFGQPAAAPQVGYGYGPTYQQLRGRLEFSPAIGYWKLRYIPIDGATDEFGGSVIVANPEAVQGFQAGDWIMVEGTPQASQNASGGYTALFTVSSIARQ